MAPLFILLIVVVGFLWVKQAQVRWQRRTASDTGKVMKFLFGVMIILALLAMASK